MKKKILSLVMSIVMTFSFVGIMPKIEAAESIESAVQWAIDRANDNSCGYSQSNRWGPTYYDCSSFVITALKNGGFDVGGATYTQNMRSNLTTHGFTWIPWSQISGVCNLKRGDILLNDSSDTSKQHTEFYIGNNQNVGAHTSKRAWNDQVSVSGFYIHPWTGILRYNGNNPFPGPIDDRYQVPVTVKANSKCSTYDSSGNMESGRWIDANDNCYIDAVHTNGYCHVKYPTGSGERWAYAQVSNFSIPLNRDRIDQTVDNRYQTPYKIQPRSATSLTLVYNVYGDAYNTSTRNIAPGDWCTIHEVYTSGFCKVTYPTSNSTHTEYAKIADFDVPLKEKPTNPKVTIDKQYYNVNENVAFHFSANNATRYCIGIDDASGKRIETKDFTSNSYTRNFSGAGQYSCYITAYNDVGWIDSQRIYFEIGTHKWSDWTIIKNSTCTVDGSKTRKCSICGKTETAVISKAEHKYDSKVIAPTCTEKGYTLHTCSACGDNYKDIYVNAKGHSWGSWANSKNATCTAEGSKTRKCSICGKTETAAIEKTGHKYVSKVVSPTCTEKGYTLHTCSVCGDNYKDTYVNAKGHSCSDWTTTKKATCTADGSKTRKCSVCGKTETSSIAKTGHKYASKIIASTCTEKGYTLHTCSVCGDNYKDTYVDAKGHSFAAKEEKDYKLFTCSGCEFSYKVTFKGDGTAESPYLISSKEDLLCLSDLMLNETTALLFRNKCYKQTNDIDLKNILWTPLGKFRINEKDSACYFEKGFVYDGGNHNIFNLNVNQAYGYAGLFGKVNKGTIKNLAVYGNVNSTTNKGYGTGGIVGELAYGATVSNCCFIGNVTSENCSGGIAGNSWRGGNIINCYFSGNVTSTNHAGGIIGAIHEKDYEPEVHNVIENCYFIGEISGKTTGGIAGVHLETGSLNKNNTSDIINCYYLKNSAEKGFGEGNANKNDSTPLISPIMKQISTDLGKAYSDNNYDTINSGFPVFNWQIPSKIKGDINNDGNMMVSDIVIMQKYLTRKTMISESQLISADLNDDGAVNAFDSIIAKRTVLNN